MKAAIVEELRLSEFGAEQLLLVYGGVAVGASGCLGVDQFIWGVPFWNHIIG
jgi:hypothetical protein